jgi:hypothetical protein
MNDFFGWAGLLVGVLAIIVGVIIFRLQRSYKRLDYEIRTDQELISRTPFADSGNLQVSYEGSVVRNPRLVVVRFINTGKSEIRRDDFEGALQLSIAEDSKVVSAEVSDYQPKSLSPMVKLSSTHEVEIDPLLLNAGDWVELRLLIDGEKPNPQVNGRIAGVRTINIVKFDPTSVTQRTLRMTGVVIGFTVILTTLVQAALSILERW